MSRSDIVGLTSLLLVCLIVVLSYLKQRWAAQDLKRIEAAELRGGAYVTVYDWEYALLYLNGRFARILPTGIHLNFGFQKHDIYILRKSDQLLTTSPLDVTSSDKLLFRLGVTLTYEITDPQQALEAKGYDHRLRIAIAKALTKVAADHTLDAFLSNRATLDEKLLALLPSVVAGCTFKTVSITTVTLPPEIRRMFTEVERAKLEGRAALERARGEHAALRSLANAARLLKGNPELMNLRVLQALSASGGKRPPTVVLGQGALLPLIDETDTAQE